MTKYLDLFIIRLTFVKNRHFHLVALCVKTSMCQITIFITVPIYNDIYHGGKFKQFPKREVNAAQIKRPVASFIPLCGAISK